LGDFINLGTSRFVSPTQLGSRVGFIEMYENGEASDTGISGNITSSSGSAGFSNNNFFIGGVDDNMEPNSSIYNFDDLNVSQTFGNQNLADIGAASFDDTLAWTSSAQGTNTISFTTIPEPSSTALLGLGALALIVRRRR